MDINPTLFFAILGILFLILELFVTSFFFIFLGIGALITATLSYYGVIAGWSQDLIVFSITSVASLLLFRKQLRELFDRKGGSYKEIIDEKAVVSHTIPEHGEGKVFYRGSDWIAYSLKNRSFKKGDYVTIKKIDGIKLIVD